MREKTGAGEKILWTLVALSSIAAGAYGYQRFKLIRPDLYDARYQPALSETERLSRIAEYRQSGDALSRAGQSPTRAPRADETCVGGYVVTIEHGGDASPSVAAQRVVENGQAVRCTPDTPRAN